MCGSLRASLSFPGKSGESTNLADLARLYCLLETVVIWNLAGNSSQPCGEVVCDKFIYPILDWSDKPGQAAGMILLGLVAMPVIQTFWWGCYSFRRWIRGRTD